MISPLTLMRYELKRYCCKLDMPLWNSLVITSEIHFYYLKKNHVAFMYFVKFSKVGLRVGTPCLYPEDIDRLFHYVIRSVISHKYYNL